MFACPTFLIHAASRFQNLTAYLKLFLILDNFRAAMGLVKANVGGNITVSTHPLPSLGLDIFFQS